MPITLVETVAIIIGSIIFFLFCWNAVVTCVAEGANVSDMRSRDDQFPFPRRMWTAGHRRV